MTGTVIDMKRPTDDEIITVMKRFGGSFEVAIANAAQVADSENLETLKLAFPQILEKFESFCK